MPPAGLFSLGHAAAPLEQGPHEREHQARGHHAQEFQGRLKSHGVLCFSCYPRGMGRIRVWFSNRVAWLASWWRCPSLVGVSAYQEAKVWHAAYNPTTADADFALAFAQRQYDELARITESIDQKADVLVRTSATMAPVLVAAIAAFKLDRPMTFLPTAVGLLLSLIIASLTRRPTGLLMANSIADLLDDLNAGTHSENELKLHTAANLHLAGAARLAVNRWKARQVNRATVLLCLAISLLALPLLRVW